MAGSYLVKGLETCRACSARLMQRSEDPIPSREVHALVDPTICADCRADNGDTEYPSMGERHLCPKCRSHQKSLRFPIWMKVASVLVFGIGAWRLPSSFREARAIRAYRCGVKAFYEDDPETSVIFLNRAVCLMPDERPFKDLEAYYSGHLCLDQRKYTEAAGWFKRSLDLDPQSKITERMLLVSQRHAAFEAKNFEGYFKLSEALIQLEGRTPDSVLGLAAAWACRSVLTHRSECRENALACLAEVQNMSGPKDPDLENLDGWVRYILEKDQILSFTDYWFTIGKGGLDDEGAG